MGLSENDKSKINDIQTSSIATPGDQNSSLVAKEGQKSHSMFKGIFCYVA